MANVVSKMIGAMGKVDNAIRGTFENSDAVCYLLKAGAHTSQYTVVSALTSGWFVETNNNELRFEYATTSTTFLDDWAEADYIGYGVPDGNDEIEVFEIDPERKTATSNRNALSVFWECIALRDKTRRFEIPSTEGYFTIGGQYITIGGQELGI